MRQYTQQEVAANIREAEKQILPAKLKADRTNAFALVAWVEAKSLEPTADAFFEAIKALYRTLEWQEGFKPAKLVMEENEQKVTKITPAFKQDEAFAAKVKAGEVTDAKKKKDGDARLQIESAITAFQPIAKGRVLFGQQKEQQDRLRRYVAQQGPNVDPTSILEQVRKEIARLYSVAERASERV